MMIRRNTDCQSLVIDTAVPSFAREIHVWLKAGDRSYAHEDVNRLLLFLRSSTRRVPVEPAFGGLGYATEAVTAVFNFGFDHYGLHRVVTQMDARNTASAALAKRVGMRREAYLHQQWWSKGGERTDTSYLRQSGD